MIDLFSPDADVHIMGCAGAGMSSLAIVLVEAGARVSGCDAKGGPVVDDLVTRGVRVDVGHSPTHVHANMSWVTASPAIARTSAELTAADDLGVRVVSRREMLASLGTQRRVVGVAGTHGKTTTTSMLVAIFHAAARDPGRLLGAPVAGIGPGGHWGSEPEILVEVDESFGTFTLVAPAALAVLNVDPDHLDYYGDVATLEQAFSDLVSRTTGPVVVWADHEGARRVADASGGVVRTVGRSDTVDHVVHSEVFRRDGSHFTLELPHGALDVSLRVPGTLNVANAATAAVLAHECGVDAEAIIEGLATFGGAPRRFERRAAIEGVDVVDDYAHLPLEVRETIAAARAAGYTSIVAVFQPHRVTRTRALAPDFADAFEGVRDLIVTDIYTAGEPNPDGINGSLVADAVSRGQKPPRVSYVPSLDDAGRVVASRLAGADLILLLGAGNVTDVLATVTGP